MNIETPGGFPRRSVLLGAACALPLAVVLKDPRLARAAAESTQEVSLVTAGGRTVTAALALPEAATAPTVLLIHEWWGLNDQIKAVAAELATLGYVALAVDLYGQPAATTPDEAKALMGALQPAEATDTLVSWIAWLRAHERSTGKVATLGWCFGGGWSLNSSIMAGEQGVACVMYYGMPVKTAKELAPLKAPILGIFAKQDGWITPEVAQEFENLAKASGKSIGIEMFDANHAFANPSNPNFNSEAAQQANQDALAFLKEKL